jgi:hypothetical protein
MVQAWWGLEGPPTRANEWHFLQFFTQQRGVNELSITHEPR